MPKMKDTRDITGYFTDSEVNHDGDVVMLSDAIADLLDEMTKPRTRWPIRNRAEREPIEARKRAIVHERDGVCWYCQDWALFQVDHIIPRSAFPANMLHIADRSDNLVSACRDCNMSKSNYEHSARKRPGVTIACWDCRNLWYDPNDYVDDLAEVDPRPAMPLLAYCGRHGNIGQVPGLDWIL